MKKLLRTYSTLTLFYLSLCLISMSSIAQSAGKVAKISIKCHVELVGGQDIIHFGIIKPERLNKYPKWLAGKKIATGFSKQKQQVYKVKECVNSKNDFINSSSKKLDKDTAR